MKYEEKLKELKDVLNETQFNLDHARSEASCWQKQVECSQKNSSKAARAEKLAQSLTEKFNSQSKIIASLQEDVETHRQRETQFVQDVTGLNGKLKGILIHVEPPTISSVPSFVQNHGTNNQKGILATNQLINTLEEKVKNIVQTTVQLEEKMNRFRFK